MKIDNPIYFEYTNAAVPIIKELEPTSISPNDNSYIETPNLFARYFMYLRCLYRVGADFYIANASSLIILLGSIPNV